MDDSAIVSLSIGLSILFGVCICLCCTRCITNRPIEVSPL